MKKRVVIVLMHSCILLHGMNPQIEKTQFNDDYAGKINRALEVYNSVLPCDIENAYKAYKDTHDQQTFCDEQYLERFYQKAKNAFRDAREIKNKSDKKSVKTTLHGLKKIGYGIAFSGLAFLNCKALYADQQLRLQLPTYYFEYMTGICGLAGLNFVLSGLWKTYKGLFYRSHARDIVELALQNKSNIAFKAHNIVSEKYLEEDKTRTSQEAERLLHLKWLWQKRIGIRSSAENNGLEKNVI
jgi:hypothetical protein